MLRSNLGVSVLPSLAVPRHDAVLTSRLLSPLENRRIYLITKQEWTLSPAAEAMIKTITGEMAEQIEQHNLSPADWET